MDFEVWGDGEQTRSFMYVDDCVEGILRIMMSGFDKPLNLGTEEMVSMNQFAEIAMSFEEKALPIRHIPGPQGVRGRNSDNTLIREKIGWEPSIPVREGLREVRCFFLPCLVGLLGGRVGCWRARWPSLADPRRFFSAHTHTPTADVLLDQGADREGARRRHPQRLRLLEGACVHRQTHTHLSAPIIVAARPRSLALPSTHPPAQTDQQRPTHTGGGPDDRVPGRARQELQEHHPRVGRRRRGRAPRGLINQPSQALCGFQLKSVLLEPAIGARSARQLLSLNCM